MNKRTPHPYPKKTIMNDANRETLRQTFWDKLGPMVDTPENRDEILVAMDDEAGGDLSEADLRIIRGIMVREMARFNAMVQTAYATRPKPLS